ncbi:hypothetical protein [Bradyrhizobium liaoningense]
MDSNIVRAILNFCWLWAFAALFALEPTSAYAYLDPGTGSVLLQGVIAAVAGGLLAIRAYWHGIVGLFRKPRPASSKSHDRTPDDYA